MVIQLTASIACLWAALAAERLRVPFDKRILLPALLGLLSPGLADTLSLFGLNMTTASMSTLIWDFQPIVIIGVALVILRERVTRPLAAFSLLATLGVVLVAGVDLNAQGNGVLIGNLLILTGVFFCSTYIVLTRRIVSTLDTLPLVALQQTVSWVGVLVIWAATELMRGPPENLLTISPTIWGWAFLSGAVYYALGFWFYITGLKRTPASLAGFFINLVPVFGVTGAYLFLSERLGTIQWVGAILILFSVANIFRLQREETTLVSAYT
jgi:drug/metabolite transporter (DMT)-like permease